MDQFVIEPNTSIDCENNKVDKCWVKYFYTICMFLNHLAFGMTCTIVAPALVDMKYIFNTSMNYVSFFPTCFCTGYLLGSLCGFFYKYINRQMTVIVLLTLLSLTTILIPYCPNVWFAYLCLLIGNLGSGAWDNANNVWLIEMWQKRSSAVMQFSQFMYGLGCIFGPLLDKPFLTGNIQTNSTLYSSVLNMTHENEKIDRRSKLKIPFLITGIIQGIIPLIFLIMFIFKRYRHVETITKNTESSKSFNEQIETQINDGSKKQKRLLITLVAICLSSYVSLELAHFQFSSTYYQLIPLGISASKAAELMSTMAATFTIGRAISAFIAIKINPEVMIVYHYCIIITAMSILHFGQDSEFCLWIGNAIIGFGFSAMWSAIFAFSEQYIRLNDKIGTILVFSCALLALFSPFILGPLIEKNPSVFLKFEFAYLSISIVLFFIMLYIVKRKHQANQNITINN